MSTAAALMLASKPPAAVSNKLVTSFTAGPDRQDFTGAAGVYFTPNKALTFNKIGLRFHFGTGGSQVVALHTPAGGTPLASATINLAGHATGDWVYADITPVTLTSGTPYMLRSEVFASSTYWWSDAAAPNAAVLRDCNLDWRSAYGFGINDSDHLGLAYPSMYVGVDLDYVTPTVLDPISLGGLVIWLDASQLTQADGATMLSGTWPNLGSGPAPSLVDSLPLAICKTNVLNGLRVVRHGTNGSRWRFTGTGITYDYTFIGVARVWNAATAGRIISSAYPTGGNLLLGWWNGNMDTCYAGAFFGPQKAQTTAWKLYSADCEAVAKLPRLFISGVYADALSTAASESWGGTFNINGSAPTLDETCDCDVAEVLLYNRKLSDTDRAAVEGYLRTKWGLP